MTAGTVKTLLIARHGTRRDTEDSQWSFQTATPYDTPLSARGIAESRQLAENIYPLLQDRKVREIAVHTSPFLRCAQTAFYACARLIELFNKPGEPQQLSIILRIDAVFSEWSNPDYYTTIQHPPDDNCLSLLSSAIKWLYSMENLPYLNRGLRIDSSWNLHKLGTSNVFGESWKAMNARFRVGTEKLLRYYGEKGGKEDHNAAVLVVTHGAGVNAMIGAISNQSFYSEVPVASASVAVLNDSIATVAPQGESPLAKWSVKTVGSVQRLDGQVILGDSVIGNAKVEVSHPFTVSEPQATFRHHLGPMTRGSSFTRLETAESSAHSSPFSSVTSMTDSAVSPISPFGFPAKGAAEAQIKINSDESECDKQNIVSSSPLFLKTSHPSVSLEQRFNNLTTDRTDFPDNDLQMHSCRTKEESTTDNTSPFLSFHKSESLSKLSKASSEQPGRHTRSQTLSHTPQISYLSATAPEWASRPGVSTNQSHWFGSNR